jgi:hypothetical protein
MWVPAGRGAGQWWVRLSAVNTFRARKFGGADGEGAVGGGAGGGFCLVFRLVILAVVGDGHNTQRVLYSVIVSSC